MEQDADFSVSPLEIQPTANLQGVGEYGEAIALASLIIGGLSLIGGGVATGIQMAQAGKARRQAREAAKQEKQTARLRALQAATQQRSQAADAAIQASRARIAAVRQEAQKQRGGAIILPAILALGIFGFIAYRASK